MFPKVFDLVLTLQKGFWQTPSHRSSPDLVGFGDVARQYRLSVPSQRFSIWFRSGDWLGHSRTLKCFLKSHSLVPLVVCFALGHCHAGRPSHDQSSILGSCCPKSHDARPRPSPAQYSVVVLTSLQKSAQKHISGMVFLGLYLCFSFLQTRQMEFTPKGYILVSCNFMTSSHASSESPRWLLGDFRRAWTCAGLIRATLLVLQDV